MIKLVVTKIPG